MTGLFTQFHFCYNILLVKHMKSELGKEGLKGLTNNNNQLTLCLLLFVLIPSFSASHSTKKLFTKLAKKISKVCIAQKTLIFISNL